MKQAEYFLLPCLIMPQDSRSVASLKSSQHCLMPFYLQEGNGAELGMCVLMCVYVCWGSPSFLLYKYEYTHITLFTLCHNCWTLVSHIKQNPYGHVLCLCILLFSLAWNYASYCSLNVYGMNE